MKKSKPPQLIPWRPFEFLPVIALDDLMIIRLYSGGKIKPYKKCDVLEISISVVMVVIGENLNV